MNWEQLQAALKVAREAGDIGKVESLLTAYAEGQNTKIEGLNGEAAGYRKTARERGDALEKFAGLDVDEFTSLKTAKAQMDEDKLKAAGQFDQLKEKLVTDHTAALQASNDAGAGWKTKFESEVIDKAFIASAAKHKAINPEEITQILRGQAVVQDDGSVIVKDATGKQIFNKEGKAQSIDGLVGDYLETNLHHVGASGSGSGSSNGGEGGGNKTIISASEIGDNLTAVAKGETVVQ